MHIPEDKIDEIRAASDIVDVVSDYVRLKKRGSNFVGLCPFHNEKTPSFNVNPRMQIYKCFGCGAGGDVYQFVKQVENIEFPEAVRLLGERANIEIPEPDRDTPESSEVESIFHALRFAARFFHEQLISSEDAESAREYLGRRGVSASATRRFGLGYAPAGWDRLLTEAGNNHINPDILEKAGLVIPRKERDGYYDRFRDRLIFPILSHVGKVLGFGGRVLEGGPDQPKYINSPETRVYHKSRVLYGLYQARQAIRREEEVLLVEGYTDVISLHQAGIEHVVATSGTALSVEQIKMLDRYCKRCVLVFDADSAGANAAVRGIDLILQQGLAVDVVQLPAEEDPDSFVRSAGREGILEFIRDQRQDFVAFKYRYGSSILKDERPESLAALQRSVLRSVAAIPDALVQDSYLKRASDVMGVPDIRLYEVFETLRRSSPRRGVRPGAPPTHIHIDHERSTVESSTPDMEAVKDPLPEEKVLLRLMLEKGSPLVEFILGQMALNEFSEGPSREIASAMMQMYEADHVDREALLDGSYGPDVQRLAAEVLVDAVEVSENWERKQNIRVPRRDEDARGSALSAMKLLKLDRVEAAIDRQRRKIFEASQAGESVKDLQEELHHLFSLRRSIKSGDYLESNTA